MQFARKLSLSFGLATLLALLAACGGETPDRKPQSVQEVAQDDSPMTHVVLTTNMGEIELALDAEKAPISVANFLAYVDNGHFEGTIFHRVIPGFMVQGGGFDTEYQKKATLNPIVNEATNGLKNVKYSIAMARTSVVNSGSSQFFINVADNAFLDHRDTSAAGFGYAVFGRVVTGTDVVDQMAAVQTGAAGRFAKDVPVEAIVIEGARRK